MFRTEKEWKDYFREILCNHFSEYTIHENVPVTQIAESTCEESKLYKNRPNQVYKAEWGQPYDFVLFDEQTAKVVIMVDENTQYRNSKYLISRMVAKKFKVRFLGFYTDFPNKENYIIERIRKQII